MNADQIHIFHNNNLCIPTKTMTLFGEVDEEMAISAVKNLHILNQTNGAISIYLNTQGGSIADGRVIYDCIKYSLNVVNIYCFGEVYSCGTLILMAGDNRVMLPSSKILLHSGNEGLAHEHPRNIDQAYANLRDDEEYLENIYLDRINEKRRKDKKKLLTVKDIRDLITWDKYMKPEEALKMGLITSIGYRLGE